jgi:zinc protease
MPVVEIPRSGSEVVKEKKYAEIGVTEWQLANGVKVVLKPTDFKNDQILFSAFSYGGESLIEDEKLIPARTAEALAINSGVGNYNGVNLEKYLADKVVSLSPSISGDDEGFSGSASPQDLELLLQLVYANFTAPRFEAEAYSAFLKRMEAILENRDNNPNVAFNDTLNALLTQYNPRNKPMTLDDLAKMDLTQSAQIFRERFADGNDFIFLFTGNFKEDSIKSLVEKYLGSLPVLESSETWRDVNSDYPQGIHKKAVYKGIEEKSLTAVVFTGDFEWNIKSNFIAAAFTDVLRIKLREKIREDKGGTYGVGVRGTFAQTPKERYQILITFGSDPKRVEELKNEVYTQIDSLVNFGVTQDYLDKVKETRAREYETNIRENNYWLNQLEFAYFNNLDPNFILQTPQMIQDLTLEDINKNAKKLLNKENYIEVILYPAAWNSN